MSDIVLGWSVMSRSIRIFAHWDRGAYTDRVVYLGDFGEVLGIDPRKRTVVSCLRRST